MLEQEDCNSWLVARCRCILCSAKSGKLCGLPVLQQAWLLLSQMELDCTCQVAYVTGHLDIALLELHRVLSTLSLQSCPVQTAAKLSK